MHYSYTLYLDDASYQLGDVISIEGIRYSVFDRIERPDDSVEEQLDADGNPLPLPLVFKKAARCYGHVFAKFPVVLPANQYPRRLVYQDSQWRLATEADTMRHAILPPLFEDVPAGELVGIFLHC